MEPSARQPSTIVREPHLDGSTSASPTRAEVSRGATRQSVIGSTVVRAGLVAIAAILSCLIALAGPQSAAFVADATRNVMDFSDYAAVVAAEVYLEEQQNLLAEADRVRRDLLVGAQLGRLEARVERVGDVGLAAPDTEVRG